MLLALLALAGQEKVIPIEDVKLGRPADFATDVLPLFRSNCLACHNSKDKEGELVLEDPKSILKGGESGPAIVPGKSGESLLLIAASHRKKPYMPPRPNKVGARPLTSRELGLIKLWIDEGGKAPLLRPMEPPRWQPPPAGWNPIYAVALDAEGRFAACGRAGRLHLYHVPTRQLISQPVDPKLDGLAHRDAVQSICFSPDGSLLATGGYRSIKLWQKEFDEKRFKLGDEPKVVAFSPDGSRIAVAGADPVIRLFDASTGKSVVELKGHTDAINALRFSADGAALLSGSADKSVRAWKIADGSQTRSIEAPAPVTAVEWLADGKQIAAGCADNLVRVFAEPVRELKGHTGVISDLRALSGKLLSGSQDGRAILWNLETDKKVRELAHGAPIVALAVAPDGKRLVTLGGSAKLWGVDADKPLAELRGDAAVKRHDQRAAALLAFAVAEVAYRQQAHKSAEEAKVKEEAEVKKAEEAVPVAEKALSDKRNALAQARHDHIGAVGVLAEAITAVDDAQARAAVAGQAEKELKAAEAQKLEAEKKVDVAKKADEAAAAAVEGARLAFESARRRVEKSKELVEKAGASIKEAQAKLEAQKADQQKSEANRKQAADALVKARPPLRAATFSSDGARLALGGEDGRVYVYVGQGEEADALELHGKPVVALGFAAGGALVSLGADGGARAGALVPAWKLKLAIEPADGAKPPMDRVTALEFSPDGKLLLSGGGVPSRAGELALWSAVDGRLVREFVDAHSDAVYDVAFNADGSLIASASADRFAKVFDSATGKLVRAFEGHTHHVLGVGWNRTGRTLSTAGADSAVKVWDVSTGRQTKSVAGFAKQVTSLRYLGFDDKFVVTTGGNQVRVVDEKGATVRGLEGGSAFMYAVSASADGKTIIAGGLDGVLRLWRADAAALVASFDPPAPAKSP